MQGRGGWVKERRDGKGGREGARRRKKKREGGEERGREGDRPTCHTNPSLLPTPLRVIGCCEFRCHLPERTRIQNDQVCVEWIATV